MVATPALADMDMVAKPRDGRVITLSA